MDFHRPNPADRPAFFLHLGDVTYNLVFGQPESKSGMYQPQFYQPYSIDLTSHAITHETASINHPANGEE
jgi:hypothetical protein